MTHSPNAKNGSGAPQRSALPDQTHVGLLGRDGRGNAASPSSGTHQFVCVAGVDRFTMLRQRVGYATSNALIGEVAGRIRLASPDCNLGRVGRTSVEFSFEAKSREEANATLGKLVDAVERPFWVDDIEFDLTITIGAVDVGDQVIDDRLIDAASAALRTAQDHHQKSYIEQADDVQPGGLDDLSLLRDLRRALKRDELTLHYQPKLRSRTETIDSAEALLRWDHPQFGPIRIDKLIELAEATGAIRELTFWVIDRAFIERRRLADDGYPLTIFVNISGILLADAGFADWALSRLGEAEGAIGFEITETAIIDEPTVAIRNLHRFVDAGIKIAIDDYGSGLSSLAYLKQLPAHELKIDQLFVKGLTESQRDPLLVRSSIDLAHALEMEVTAEGVDNQMALSLLRIMGCDLIQGYLISPPLPAAELLCFLKEDRHLDMLAATASMLAAWNVDPGTAAEG